MDSSTFVIIGANGQLGTALRAQYPDARAVDSAELDITDRAAVEAFDWEGATHIFNAAAYTNVDGAETPEGRVAAWQVNAVGPANLAVVASRRAMTLIHISSDYVFDGENETHSESEPFSPLGVYGQTKAAGDIAVSVTPQHYIIRTSWVIGDGKNFVRTMLDLGKKGINPTIVADQIGRLTFTSEIVRAIDHFLAVSAPYGTYNVTNAGEPASWADIARQIFTLAGFTNNVTDTTTAEYFASKSGVAPRPLHSTLIVSGLPATGFKPRDWQDDLQDYIQKELAQ